MKVLGVIIAGGKSSRMGQEKALMAWQGKPLIAHVVERLVPQVEALAINANGDTRRFGFLGLPVFPDELNDIHTPLAGLHAALAGAANNSFDAVLTVPCASSLCRKSWGKNGPSQGTVKTASKELLAAPAKAA